MARVSDVLVTGVVLCSAIAVGGAALHREFAPKSRAPEGAGAPTYHKDWKELSAVGKWIGDSNAKVKIVEFADFECPYCRRFHLSYSKTREIVGKDVALLFVEYPLSIHKFAKPAAYAAECAAKQGRWEEFHDALFMKQDSFGLKSWASYAQAAGIRDTASFTRCTATMASAIGVDSAIVLGKTFQLRGTPTILIDGWQYPGVPYDSLTSIVQRELADGPRKAPASK